ncbi:MAG TPA: fatty acid desaturase CarF family protein, partial [Myxococcota bacterium]
MTVTETESPLPIVPPGLAPGDHARPLGHRLLELGGIVVAVGAVIVLLGRCLGGIAAVFDDDNADRAVGHGVAFAAALACGSVVADFLSGVVHFTFDRFFSSDTPLIGRNFVLPFRQHHADPQKMTRHGFIETNGNNCLATCPALIGLLALPVDYTSRWQLFVVALLTSTACGEFVTNQIHRWAHVDQPPAVVAWLQARRLVLPRRHHQVHHTWPYDSHYCITTGWCNEPLRRLQFWKGLEWFYTRVLRLRLYTEST